ncbi:GGDEF domain-containing protein [Bradyrhizobium sp.]|uniref:GGDEF domain-containing protein n=1 Tax=Bradyrhizobium sp. TaxID=376 RepID=UPI003C776F49
MLQLGIAPTPGNFAVWFNYSRGTLPELKRTIDILIAGNKRFDSATNRQLFSTYLAPNSAGTTVGNLPEQLKSILTEAKRFVTIAIADNRSQIEAIGDVAEQAESGLDPTSLVERLVEELTKAATRASELEMNLGETSRELDVIRESLNRAEQRANTDMLTGLPNRRAFDEFLRTTQISAMETGEPFSILLIDIDRFKQFNDSFGHGVGDEVLRLMASALRERVRAQDLPARYGGEELIAVLPGADLAVCEAAAERIRSSISECRITRRSTGERLPSITVSIGVAQFRPGESTAQLIERCDGALYLAKRTGRNRVVTEVRLEGRSVA